MPKKVLIVEDDANIAELLHLYLEKEGFESQVAKDGGKGVELFVQNVRDFMIDLFIARSEQFLFAFKIKVNTAGSCVRDLTDMLHPHSINSVKADRFDSGLN